LQVNLQEVVQEGKDSHNASLHHSELQRFVKLQLPPILRWHTHCQGRLDENGV
jgi:hypothetical protein